MTGLQPLDYHVDVVQRLAQLEPAGWRAFATVPDPVDSTRLHAELTRTAYRLDPAAHPRLAAAVAAATAALGIEIPVTVYQLEGDLGSNAALLFRRSEAVVTLSGTLLERLTDAELTAVLGHELAHHRLWTFDGGRFLTADRILDALVGDARTPEPFLETARRWNLATELFADRGALAACGDLQVAVSCLIKVATGLSTVDPAGYLRQAELAEPGTGSRGRTHPETVLRAWALHRWQTDRSASPDSRDAAASTLLHPGLDLDRLDLADRESLELLTRDLITAYLTPDWLRSDLVLAHARQFFPELPLPTPATPPAPTTPPDPATPPALPDGTAETTRRYLGYVLLDLATVDPDLDDRPLVAAQALADRLAFGAVFADLARAELIDAGAGRPARRGGRRAPGRQR